MTNIFPCVKLKYPNLTLRIRYCAFDRNTKDPTTIIMLSSIQRVIRHAFIISRQGFGRAQVLNIGKLSGQGHKVRVSQALTKNAGSNNSDLFQFILRSLAGTAREVFITNVLRRNNTLAKSPAVWQRFGNGVRPFFGLVGVGLVSGGQTLTQDYEFESICGTIRVNQIILNDFNFDS